jgi:hypothetical protein
MPVNQGNMSVSIGRDASVVLVHPLAPGGRVELPNVTGFMANPEFSQITVRRLDGQRLSASLPDGWNGSFDAARHGPGVDDLMALIEAAWRTAGVIYSASVFLYVTEPTGAISTWQFTECSVEFPELGSWRGDAEVMQKIGFRANRRLKV